MNNRHIKHSPAQLSLDFSTRDGIVHQDSSLVLDHITCLANLFKAWAKFCRGKRSRLDVLIYERHLEENIFDLHKLLVNGQYKHSTYTPFQICDPKQRQIHKATVQDRLVHQAVVSAIEPLFEQSFIFDSYSCRKNKGTHAAVARLRKFLCKASNNNTRTVYILKCDVKQFFASVDHGILMNLLKQKITDDKTLALLQKIIKSLHHNSGKGIPLGNLTSQLFANIYLHELDWFIKNCLREKYYVRYCDDFVIASTNRKHLEDLIEKIVLFLDRRLKLTIHPHKITIHSWHQGVDFLGYVLKPYCTLLRTKTKNRMLLCVNEVNFSSYLGLCSHADSYRLQQTLHLKVWNSGFIAIDKMQK